MIPLTDLKRAVILAPEDASSRYALAEALFAEGEYAGATTQLEKALQLAPSDGNVRRLLAKAYERNGKAPKAVALLEEAARRSPEDAHTRDELCGLLLTEGRIDDALLHAAEAVRLAPEDPQRHLLLADLLRRRQLLPRARAVLEEAQRRFPEHAPLARELRELYLELGEEAAAERVAGEKERSYFQKQARQALSSPKVAQALCAVQPVVQRLLAADLTGARRELANLPAEAKATAAHEVVHGEILLLEQKLSQAEGAFRAALERDPAIALAWNRLGDLAQTRNDLRGALSLYKKAVLFGGDDANAWEDLGDVHATLGELPQAEKMYRAALERDPQSGAAQKLASLHPKPQEAAPAVGKIGVLGWHPQGGAVSPLEAVAVQGAGELIFSGNVGPVGKEAAAVAYSVLKARSTELGLDGLVRSYDLHLHFTDTHVGKEGPSAGLALLLAGVSAFTKKPLLPNLAATGELTLHGEVRPVGGIHEKLVAACLAGVRTVLLPKQNLKDARALPEEVTRVLTLIYVDSVADAIQRALVPGPARENP